jgi:hypothetical protein
MRWRKVEKQRNKTSRKCEGGNYRSKEVRLFDYEARRQ